MDINYNTLSKLFADFCNPSIPVLGVESLKPCCCCSMKSFHIHEIFFNLNLYLNLSKSTKELNFIKLKKIVDFRGGVKNKKRFPLLQATYFFFVYKLDLDLLCDNFFHFCSKQKASL